DKDYSHTQQHPFYVRCNTCTHICCYHCVRCVSRQLWWGHRIPAYKVVEPKQTKETWVVGRDKREALSRACATLGLTDASVIKLEQDEDVLDTWFSSGLFPFSVFGWPEDTPELKAYFPTTLLETGHDILFFWVARMVMLSLELTGELPFSTVFLHAMVRDAHGQKMSKSKGNVIDPLEVISGISLEDLQKKLRQGNLPEKEIKRAEEVLKKEFPNGIGECGCDALRMGLLAYTRQGRSVNLDLNRVVGYRHFCNKLWNATKFCLDKFARAASIIWGVSRDAHDSHLSGGAGETPCCKDNSSTKNKEEEKDGSYFKENVCFIPEGIGFSKHKRHDGLTRNIVYEDLQWIDRWILHRLATTCAEVEKAFASYAFADVVTAVYGFFLYDFCDYYLEIVKTRLTTPPSCPSQDSQISSLCALEVLYNCLDKSLRLLHPLCPFITEELYQRLPPHKGKVASITLADFPQAPLLWLDCKLADNMVLFKLIVTRFRSLAAALEIPPKIRPAGYIRVADSETDLSAFLAARESEVVIMANMSSTLQNGKAIGQSSTTTHRIRSWEPVKVMGDDFVGERCVSDVVTGTTSIFLSVEEGVNLAPTCQKLKKKKTNLEKMVQSYIQKEAMPAYEDKVPQEIREQNAARKKELQMELSTLLHAIRTLENLCREESG
ncbi:probable valine--tRNA ligase, cytoplasmic, partial [Ochotona princeps]|uniref:probable valine--tRNA ligase, cytoplasmic n=1 Tax=Ochotona princeps TaxID=9978 RepID=UPI002714EFF7